MSGRRQSARIASLNQNSSPPQSQPQKSTSAGRKRKNEATGNSPTAKRGKKDDEPKQQTLEQTLSKHEPEDEELEDASEDAEDGVEEEAQSKPEAVAQNEQEKPAASTEAEQPPAQQDVEMTGANGEPEGPPTDATQPKEDLKPQDQTESHQEHKSERREDPEPEQSNDNKPAPRAEPKPEENGQTNAAAAPSKVSKSEENEQSNGTAEAKEEVRPEPKEEVKPESNEEETPESKEEQPQTTSGTAVIPQAREDDVPSSILEKGIIYFFFRARVNVDDPQDVKDIARTYIILRPIPLDSKLGDGPIGDDGNCRLLAVPKKVLPLSGKDRFMTFVEKAKTTFSDLKDSFLSGSDYATKTAGTSHSPPVTPLAEGVYAVTSTGRESHLAYILTIPSELGEVQKDLGLKERGSFVASVKNPTAPAPANASLPQGPDYPKEVLDEFRGLRWKPLEPKFLDYVNTQFLIIGESFDNATEQRPKDERENNGLPSDEMEKLEGEDEIRVQHLKGDDTVFVDLDITSREYPKLATTW